jgi:hypothetical protein
MTKVVLSENDEPKEPSNSSESQDQPGETTSQTLAQGNFNDLI